MLATLSEDGNFELSDPGYEACEESIISPNDDFLAKQLINSTREIAEGGIKNNHVIKIENAAENDYFQEDRNSIVDDFSTLCDSIEPIHDNQFKENGNTYGANAELNDNKAMDYETQELKHDNMQYAVDFERNVQVSEICR